MVVHFILVPILAYLDFLTKNVQQAMQEIEKDPHMAKERPEKP